MIVRDKPDLVQLLTATRGSIIPQVARPVLALAALAAVTVAADRITGAVPHLDGQAFAVFGIGLSLFLGFRNNAAYDRWWEGRKLWGGLLADLRSLAREVQVFVPDPARARRILLLARDFLHAHRRSLRGLAGTGETPCALLDRLGSEIATGHRSGEIDGFGARSLMARVARMADQQAGCERIANSPLPYVYSLLVYRTAYLYCLLLPLALVDSTGWLTPLLVAVVAYMFLGLAEVSEELSHPFAPTPNGVPLDAICRAAEISLAPHLAEAAPPPLTPVDHYLG